VAVDKETGGERRARSAKQKIGRKRLRFWR